MKRPDPEDFSERDFSKKDFSKKPHGSGINKKQMKKNIRRVFWLYFALFAALTIYLIKFLAVDSAGIITGTYNPRLRKTDDTMIRGSVLDANGKTLAITDEGKRLYPLGESAAHLVGYADYAAGFYGVEARYNFQMQSAHNELLQRLNNVLNDTPVIADSLVLTLDSDLQRYVYEQLWGKSAAVVLDVSTGKILAMASRPSFDPQNMDFDMLKNDERAPLLNRATQGLYPPGSIFKIITAAAAMEYDMGNMIYTCEGQTVLGKRIRCYNLTAHGEEDLALAFAKSCNTFFATLGVKLGDAKLKTVAERAYFNSAIPYALEYSVSRFSLTDEILTNDMISNDAPLDGIPSFETSISTNGNEPMLADTAIGQGETLIVPLLAAMITACVANDGIMMAPYIVDHIQTYNGAVIQKNMPQMMKMVFTPEQSAMLTEMMTQVTEIGTGNNAYVEETRIAAKTGTAENSSGEDHGWYTAFFPADAPKYAIAIIVENSGGSASVLPIAKNIVKYLT
ncbi:MAG: penicillin-binding protein 2 [Clostridiales bacterium]|jgi:peptidoglycan glycosyltransferase|nr:penicillin-binding protein 2 [Clostridiales bacterium]